MSCPGISADVANAAADQLPDLQAIQLAHAWTARPAQKPPAGDWNVWLILAGRGFGKTRTGAEWINRLAVERPGISIGLIGATQNDARSVMVEGESGLLMVNPAIGYEPSRRLLTWKGIGSTARIFSAEEPDGLRGPQFHCAWGDEVARWADGSAVLGTLRMALRLGATPQLLLTTTPRPLKWLKALSVGPGVVTTRGRTIDNARNLPPSFIDAVTRDYGGTRFGRQELDGEFIEDNEGALWTRAGLEACRIGGAVPAVVRTVVGVDPPAGASAASDACGIIVVGLTEAGTALVLADRSVQGLQPEDWARAVVAAFDDFNAGCIVVEVNNGGAMVTSTLRGVAPNVSIRTVHASQGKVARAEPVAALYGTNQVFHAGSFPALEDEMCAMGVGGRWSGPGRSPDRVDALVYALTELMLGPRRAEPSVRPL